MAGTRTIVPLELEAYESVFVVFREPTENLERRVPGLTRGVVATLDGPWAVSFQAGRGAPAVAMLPQLESWTASTEPGIKYFSGTAAYHRTVDIPNAWLGQGSRMELDLGAVKNLVEVSVNGRSLGVLWKPPFRIDMTDALKAGSNNLEIRVTNLWPNRMIGDKQPGATKIAFATLDPYKPDSPLLESGLLGPVRLSILQTAAP
jgi:hypothetical protein